MQWTTLHRPPSIVLVLGVRESNPDYAAGNEWSPIHLQLVECVLNISDLTRTSPTHTPSTLQRLLVVCNGGRESFLLDKDVECCGGWEGSH